MIDMFIYGFPCNVPCVCCAWPYFCRASIKFYFDLIFWSDLGRLPLRQTGSYVSVCVRARARRKTSMAWGLVEVSRRRQSTAIGEIRAAPLVYASLTRKKAQHNLLSKGVLLWHLLSSNVHIINSRLQILTLNYFRLNWRRRQRALHVRRCVYQ